MAAVPGKHQEGGLHQDPAEDRLPYFISWGGYIELNFVLLWKSSISKWKRGGKKGGHELGIEKGVQHASGSVTFEVSFLALNKDVTFPGLTLTIPGSCTSAPSPFSQPVGHSGTARIPATLPLIVTKPTWVAHLKLHVKGS